MAGYFMGMHRDLRMRKFLQATISSAKFLSIPTITKFTKSVKYIHDDSSWERCYVLLKILHPCLRVLRLADSNLVGMDKVYKYLRMTKQCFDKKIRSWLSEIFSWRIITSQYTEHVWWRKWWRRANSKGFNFIFWKYMFFHIQLVE